MKILFGLLLTFLLSYNSKGQHPEDFLNLVLTKDWMSKNGIKEIVAKQRWANRKGKLRGKAKTIYHYTDSLEYIFEKENRRQVVTDTSITICRQFPKVPEFCQKKIIKNGKIIRIESQALSRISYFSYTPTGKISKIWIDNNSYGNEGDGIIIYQYAGDQLVMSIDVTFSLQRYGDHTLSYLDFPIKKLYQTELQYNKDNLLASVKIYKGESFNVMDLHRLLTYSYDVAGIPLKTVYYNIVDGQRILESEIEFTYIY